MGENMPSSVSQRAGKALIRYPRFMELQRHIERCQTLTKELRDPQCLALEGETGVGKTTIVKTYVQKIPRIKTETGMQIPVFYFLTPSPVTVKGLASAMLDELGDPLFDKGTLTSMNTRLVHYLQACRVELVILDDFHHLIDLETDRVLQTVSDWLKVLIRKSEIPFLVVGIEGKVQRILRANAQLSRHFTKCEILRPFPCNDQNSIEQWNLFIGYIEEALGMSLTVDITRYEVLRRIHYATSGVVGNLMNLMRYAAIVADEAGRTGIKLADLSWAYEARLADHMGSRINPFGDTVGATFVAPERPPLPPEEAVRKGRGRKNTKKDEPPLSEILST